MYDARQIFSRYEEDSMQWIIACLIFITGMVAYFPVIYIRKFNKLLDVLKQVEQNTRKS